jgi:hypothetical protein
MFYVLQQYEARHNTVITTSLLDLDKLGTPEWNAHVENHRQFRDDADYCLDAPDGIPQGGVTHVTTHSDGDRAATDLTYRRSY